MKKKLRMKNDYETVDPLNKSSKKVPSNYFIVDKEELPSVRSSHKKNPEASYEH